LRTSPLLRECVPCVPAGYEEHFRHLTAEQLEREALQAQEALELFFKPAEGVDAHDVVVCHGNLIRYFMLKALRAPVELWANTDVHHCGIDEIVVKTDARVLLVSHNDTGHLPYNMRTYG
jgi:serine/threonine-protein phosphatase PGAM5